ncbi:transcriptional regulator [Nocardioides antri]|nr:transcriptional regulator [Nocardioides antri]
MQYSALLGFYLGDGHISRAPRYYRLRITCDQSMPGIIRDVVDCIGAVRPSGKIFLSSHPGAVDVISNWQHWPCLFPQHGPGRKQERPIALEDWQRRVVADHQAHFLRGPFHSDGCRVTNSTCKVIAGAPKRYEYPRWQFVNASADIRALCCWALDLAGVAWRQSNPRVISVSRREAVAALDALIGLKS